MLSNGERFGHVAKAQTIASVLAAQIRSQGIACDEPQKATRDAKLSKPDYDVWVLTCKNATYRIGRYPDMAAKVEKLKWDGPRRYPPSMTVRRPFGFIEPCLPSRMERPPSGPLWVHEIKHDGYRLMVRRVGARVRCFNKGGHDWADRFPAIVDAALRIKAASFLIDGEAVIACDDGTPDFRALRSKRRGHEAVLYAFDLIEHDGDDLRDLPLIKRKRRLARLIGRAKRCSIQFTEHLTGDGPTVFEHVCRMGLEGIVSKRTDAPYRSGASKTWVKTKNPASEAVRRSARRSGAKQNCAA
jgi:bifunctional non-homologous end joining protein LigD